MAHVVATRLKAPLEVFLVRKLGVPGHPELAMGAIAEGGIEVLSRDLIRNLGVPRPLIEQVAVRERLEMERRDALYRGVRRRAVVRDRIVILVDDGLATGSTMIAAVRAARAQNPARIVVAVGVAPPSAIAHLRAEADDVVCLLTPGHFMAVGEFFEEFLEVTDDDVVKILARQPVGMRRSAS